MGERNAGSQDKYSTKRVCTLQTQKTLPSAPVTLTKPFFNMATFALLRICKGGRGAAHINNGLEFSIHIEKINDKTGTQKIPSPAILGMLWVF